jgi:hypothetical protein
MIWIWRCATWDVGVGRWTLFVAFVRPDAPLAESIVRDPNTCSKSRVITQARPGLPNKNIDMREAK